MENKVIIDIDRVYELLPDYPKDDSNLLTIKEFAGLIREKPRTLYRFIESGKIPNKFNIFFKTLPYYKVYKIKHSGLKGKKIIRILADNLSDDIKEEVFKIVSKRNKRKNSRSKLICNVSIYLKEKLKFLATVKGTTINNLVNEAIESHIKSEKNR